ncbi:NUDIX hydrolase [Planobispora siamensis]|uniref:NUDIX hydrolase n=1 Tax=Planobispora siamensis TaxID=936338 RepID=UPI00194FABB6|nr:NUDIX domain-containing protein [Planobispora siamensis]
MPEAIHRPTARILLLDDDDRILLWRGLGPTENPEYAWFTPGGGVDPGETLTEAAARELREETGNTVSPEDFGPVVAVSSGYWRDRDGRLFRAEDSYFLLRLSEPVVDVSGMEDLEHSLLDTFRWWTLPELRTGGEFTIPVDLAALLERLLSDPPQEPIVLPWHRPEITPEIAG